MRSRIATDPFYRRNALCVGLAVLLSGCASVGEPEDYMEFDKPGRQAADKEECQSSRGVWTPVGLLATMACVFRPKDAREPCDDARQCESTCITDNVTVNVGKRTKGVCASTFLLFGCLQRIVDGRAGVTVCVD